MVPSTVLSAPADQPRETQPPDARPAAGARSFDRWRPLVGTLPAVLLVAVSVWELVAAQTAGGDVPDDADWTRASAAVRARHQPGDLIVFAPRWLDPVGRLHLGDLMPIDHVARMDDARFFAVWELSIRGASAPESRGREVAFSQRFGDLHVRKLTRAPVEVVTDFVARFKAARAQVKLDGRSAGSPQVALEEVGFAPHRCVRVEPLPDQTVRMTFKDVALGSALVGYVGLADVFTRRDIRAPGRLQVFVGERELIDVTFGVDDGWIRFSAETEASESAVVTFAATAVGARARKRLICFAAEARR